jgi:hypothetical protein
MDLSAKRPPLNCLGVFLSTLLLVSGMGVASQDRSASVSASCGRDCVPAPSQFEVPRDATARAFTIRSLSPGSSCSGASPRTLKGFSIRRGAQTVLVYYIGPAGTVSDPVPIQELELPSGTYQLYAAPASGSGVTLSFVLDHRQ